MEILKHTGENDYEFESDPNNYHSCWITVKNLSIYLNETDEGVIVDIYPLGHEADEPITSTYAFFNEAKRYEE